MPILQTNVRVVLAVMIGLFAMAEVVAQSGLPDLPPLTSGATHETRTPDIPGLSIYTSLCQTTPDPTYGATPDNPIKVGGGPLYLAGRSRRFLNTLRGLSGEGLHYKRLGSFEHTDGTILDVYLVKHGDRSRHFYVDGYHWEDEPPAPAGLLCSSPMQLNPPPPDPFANER